MARLYCAAHGQEFLQIARDPPYTRDEGEGVIITRGLLETGPWRCDECNLHLDKGDEAYFISFVFADDLDSYDFRYEREYMAVHRPNVELLGLEWPNERTRGYKQVYDRFDYTFDSPVGVWKARLEAKALGKKRGTLLLYFTELGTEAKYALCLFWTSCFCAEQGGINFNGQAQLGDVFELETALTRTGRRKLPTASKIG